MAHPNALNAKLGHAASIGGAAYVERAALSDETMNKLVAMDAPARKKALEILQKARSAPAKPKAPMPRGRVKVRWTDELIARLKREAVWCKTIPALTRKLGLPEHCQGSVERACRRHAPGSPATCRRSATRKNESPAAALSLAA